MYMSGRALHPLTVTLAKRVSEELGGRVPISFCGGADAQNFADLVADGLIHAVGVGVPDGVAQPDAEREARHVTSPCSSVRSGGLSARS